MLMSLSSQEKLKESVDMCDFENFRSGNIKLVATKKIIFIIFITTYFFFLKKKGNC